MKITTDYNPKIEEINAIRDGIIKFNTSRIGEKAKPLLVTLKNDDGKVMGGVIGWLYSSSLYVDVLWVEEQFRGQDYGTNVLRAAEDEAIKHGCQYSTLDTYDFQAEAFYLKNGYQRIAVIEEYLLGHTRIYLRKDLNKKEK